MRILLLCLVTIGGVLGTGHLVSGEQQTKDAPDSEGSSREADRAAILQSGRDFTAAFEKGDAKAVAALWTEQGEYEQRPRTRLESWGTHDHYDDARLWSTVSCECEDG